MEKELYRIRLAVENVGQLMEKLVALQVDDRRCCRAVALPAQPTGSEPVYRDADYTCDRVGISDSTLLRCQQRGEIRVAKRTKGKKYFLDSEVEHLRNSYRGSG